jgi:putative membrane protein
LHSVPWTRLPYLSPIPARWFERSASGTAKEWQAVRDERSHAMHLENVLRKPLCLLVTLLVSALTATPVLAADGFSRKDKELVKDAVRNLQTSTQAARIARDRAEDKDVQKFADQVIGGDDKLIDQLRELSEKNNFRFDEDPTRPDERRLDDLKDLRGREFDRRFVSAAMHDQQELVKIFKRGAEEAENDDLRDWFKKKDEAVRAHAETARELNRRFNRSDDPDR